MNEFKSVLNEVRKVINGKDREIIITMLALLANGNILIENEVVAQYAGLAAVECFGIVGMATVSMKDGLVKMLRGDSVSKGVSVDIDDNSNISIDVHIIVAYGVSISTVADNLMSTVIYKVEN